jgi:hypothetical protein
VSPVRHELGSFIPEDAIFHSHRHIFETSGININIRLTSDIISLELFTCEVVRI